VQIKFKQTAAKGMHAMVDGLNKGGFSILDLTTQYMPRPRIYDIFEQAATNKLVYVIAGTGYGKTQAAHNYIRQQQDVVVWWIQLTENDNISSRFWESYRHSVSVDNPELAAKLREFGFPETSARFKQFAEIIRTLKGPTHKIFFVLDDFHLIHSEEAILFAERCAHLQIPGVCIVIISRKEPGINAVSLISKGKVGVITEDDLRFTVAEAESFFLQQAIPFSQQSLLQMFEAVKGWPIGMNMLAAILKRRPGNLKYALDVMAQNIMKLLETEAWDDFAEQSKKALVKLSLLSNLPAASLKGISDEAGLPQDISGLDSFIRFDDFANGIKIHPLYLEFLQNKHHILSHEERQETYQKAARWCAENDFYMDAMRYYAKLGQFELMIKTLLSYPFKLPCDASEYLLSIIENLHEDSKGQQSPSLLFLKNFFTPLLLAGLGRLEEAKNRSLMVIKEWELVDDPLAHLFLYTSYSNLSYIDMYTCTYTHEYNSPVYLKKSVEYSKRTSIPPAEITGVFVNADVRSFACAVGENAGLHKLDEFLEAAKQVALLIEETHYKVYAGYDDLVACEYSYFKNQPNLARNHAHNAILKARDKKQHSIEAMADNYLLRIAMQEGDASLVKETLRHMRSHLDNPDFWNRQMYYDLYTGAFYARIGLPEMVPQWLVMDEKEAMSRIRMPMRELIVSAIYYISAKKYQQALMFLCNSYPREPHERFLFGESKLLLLTAIAKIKTDDTQGALVDFTKAYQMSFNGMFEMFFIERGKELHPLVVAALNQTDCGIPEEWLKTIDRRASIYEKKIAVVTAAIKNEHNIKESILLSNREIEVLKDMYHGLSREEIAANQYLSINTVKKTLQSIYVKLDASNNVDAVRVALEKKLID